MSNTNRILFAGDQPAEVDLVEIELHKSGFNFISKRIKTPDEFKKSLVEFSPNIIISNYSSSVIHGLELLKIALTYDENIPFIMIHDSGNELFAVESMKAGATDYIVRSQINRLPDSLKEALNTRKSKIEKVKTESSIKKSQAIRSLLIDNLPFIALVLKKNTREIVACNKLASEAGAVVGKTCFETLPQCSQVCPFCKASSLWKSGNEQSVRTEYMGRHWEGRWLPFSDDLYVHYIWDITEQVETREELQNSRQNISDALEFNRKILNSSSIGILTYRKSGKCVTANAAAARIEGTSVEKLLEQNFHEILSWKKSELYKAAVNTLETGIDQTLEVHQLSSFGTESWLNVSVSSFDSKGEKHLLLMTSDISERKKAEHLLTTSESRFKSIFKSNFISIAFWNINGEILDANDSYLNLVGYTRDDLISGKMSWIKMTPPEYTDLDQIGIQESNEKGFCSPYEKEYIRKDGSRIHILIGGAFIEGMNKGGVTFVIDISKSKKAEKALQESEENMRYIVKHDPNAIAVYDRNLNYIAVSDRYFQDYGIREEDIIGKHHYDVFPEMPQRWKDVHQRCLSGIIERNDDDYFERPDGSITYNRWECRPWYLSNGEIGGMITYTEVTTDRRLAEKALKKSNESLEKLYNHLFEIRENERAAIARDLHDQLGQSLTALKLDINRLKGYSYSNPEATTILDGLVEMVTNTITDVQRITADLRPGILDDLGLVSAIEWYCGEFSGRTGIKCRLSPGNLINLDSQQSLIFFRVLQEALTNVIRHANATSVKISLHQTHKGTTLSVQDNGTGITKEQAESGKSLGLIGIRERIKQSKGMFNISSKEGTGTKLTIFIPCK